MPTCRLLQLRATLDRACVTETMVKRSGPAV